MSLTSTRLVTCEWCGTVNDANHYKCVLCDIEIGIPTLDRLTGKDLDAAIASTYTRGGARLVAERLVDGRLPFHNSWRERQCVRLALAELLTEMNTTLLERPTTTASYSYLGWRWPESPLPTQTDVRVFQGARVEGSRAIGGRLIHTQRQRRYPRRKAENIHLPIRRESEDVLVSVSLLTEVEGRLIGTHPRVVHSSRS